MVVYNDIKNDGHICINIFRFWGKFQVISLSNSLANHKNLRSVPNHGKSFHFFFQFFSYIIFFNKDKPLL